MRAGVRWVSVLLTVWALPLPASAQLDMPHGIVDPCTVAFVEDSLTKCEACAPEPGNPESCSQRFAALGYTRKCRTGPHGVPGEVWCLVPKPPAPKQEPVLTPRATLLAVVASVSALLALFVLWKRWRRSRKS